MIEGCGAGEQVVERTYWIKERELSREETGSTESHGGTII
jgi:hypothetical protein